MKVLHHMEGRASLLLVGLLMSVLTLGVVVFGFDRAYASAPKHHSKGLVPRAKASIVETVNEQLTFEITQIKGNVIYATGQSLGKFTGTAYLHMRLLNASKAIADIYGNNSRGTIQGSGAAGYHASGAISYFTGGNPTLHGTGKYSALKSLGMSMTGTMNRRTLKISFDLRGKWNV
jgi:hypothetical protein